MNKKTLEYRLRIDRSLKTMHIPIRANSYIENLRPHENKHSSYKQEPHQLKTLNPQTNVFLHISPLNIKKQVSIKEGKTKNDETSLSIEAANGCGRDERKGLQQDLLKKSKSFFSLQKHKNNVDQLILDTKVETGQDNNQVQQFIEKIIDKLRSTSSLRIRSDQVSIKMETLISLLLAIVSQFSGSSNQIISSSHQIRPLIEQIHRAVQSQRQMAQVTRLSIQTQVFSQLYTPKGLKKSDLNDSIIASLQSKLAKKDDKIRILDEKVAYLNKLCLEKHYQITEMERKSSKQYNENEEKEPQLINIQEQSKTLADFVNLQNQRPIIRDAATKFKAVERQTLQFVQNWQREGLTSEVSNQIQSFRGVEQKLVLDVKQFSQMLLKSNETPLALRFTTIDVVL